MSSKITRRTFIGTGSAAALVAAGCTESMVAGGALEAVAPAATRKPRVGGDKFNVALIGCGGMGRYKLGNFMDSGRCNVVALCDVDDSCSAQAAEAVSKKLGNQPKIVKEYRRIIDLKDVDVVIVATPDHWHAAPMMLACQAGKDVYCEKPCCHNVREAQAMLRAARKYGCVVQVGTHQRSMKHIQAAREFVQDGKLGTISMTHTYTYGNNAPDGLGHTPDEPVPAGVDYNTWLGPAPVRPFNRRRFHSSWRWYFDYGCGMVGDWNVHLQDIVMWSMGVTAPLSVATSGGHLVLTDDRDTPDVMQAVYEFGPAAQAPKGFVHTYTMRKTSGKPWSAGGYGMDFHGTSGMVHLTRNEYRLEADRINWDDPNSPFRAEGFKQNHDGADQVAHQDHVNHFLDCVVSGSAPIASIEQHYHSVVACHLANVSLQVGRKIFWDADKALCYRDADHTSEDHEANRQLTREYRKGFDLPRV